MGIIDNLDNCHLLSLREGLTRKKKKWEISHFFYCGGEGTPLPESQNFLDIIGKNLVVFYKFSRCISEKINSFDQNVFQPITKCGQGDLTWLPMPHSALHILYRMLIKLYCFTSRSHTILYKNMQFCSNTVFEKGDSKVQFFGQWVL